MTTTRKRRKINRTKTGKPITHGTTNAYSNHGCKCDECRSAWAAYVVEKNHRLGYARPRDEFDASRRAAVPHGGPTMYGLGCRCDACREGARQRRTSERRKARRKGAPDYAHGTVNGAQNFGCRCEDCKAAERRAKARSVGRNMKCPLCGEPCATSITGLKTHIARIHGLGLAGKAETDG